MNKDYQYLLVPQKYATVHSAPITPGVEMSDMSVQIDSKQTTRSGLPQSWSDQISMDDG